MKPIDEFPFPVKSVPGEHAEGEILRLRDESSASGKPISVIIGDKDTAFRVIDIWDEPFDLVVELAAAAQLSPGQWFADRRKEDEEYILDDSQNEIHAAGVAPMTRLTAGYDHRNQPRAEVLIAALPTLDPTAIPVHLRFGDWNSCPSPHIHMALARYWGDRFGAQIVTLSSDVIEYTVIRPPKSDAEALELAWQQYLYCVDIVDQGVGSVATLAKALRHSTRWYFWWD